MASPKTAALSGLLVSKKGTDIPRPEHPGLEEAQTPQPTFNLAGQSGQEEGKAQSLYYKALTLKVDKDRFTKLKDLGVRRDLRSQTLMTEALDLLFAKHRV